MTKEWKWNGLLGWAILSAMTDALAWEHLLEDPLWVRIFVLVGLPLFVGFVVVVPWYSYGLVKGAAGHADPLIIKQDKIKAAKRADRLRVRLERLET